MKENTSIKLKATFLLIVFTMNTIIGFACAMGLNMGFNSSHHHDEVEATEVTTHSHHDGKVHQHYKEAAKHTHDKKDDCCNDKAIKIQTLDKLMAQNFKTLFSGHEFATIQNMNIGLTIFKPLLKVPQKNIIPTFHPPPPDIRVFIQSFQI